MIKFKRAEGTMMRMSSNATHAGAIHKGTQKIKAKSSKMRKSVGWVLNNGCIDA